MDSATQSSLRSLHHGLVHRWVCVDCASDAVSIYAQYLSQGRLANHLSHVVAHEVCAEQLLLAVEDKFYEAVCLRIMIKFFLLR